MICNKWSRTSWLLSKSSALSSCSPPPVGLKGKPICSDVSHILQLPSMRSWRTSQHGLRSWRTSQHGLKAIACLTLSIVTMVLPPCLSSNLPAYLRSGLVKIMPINFCFGFRFIVRLPPFLRSWRTSQHGCGSHRNKCAFP